MTRWSSQKLAKMLAIGLLVWVVIAAGCTLVGSSGRFGLPRDGDGRISQIILRYRVGVVLLASLIGLALAVAGTTYQAILQNPLADPYLLGVSSGAMLFSYLWTFPATNGFPGIVAALGEQGFSFAGAIVAVAIVFALSLRRGRLEPITMLLVGVIVNAVNASIFLLLNSIYKDPARPGGPIAFLVGGLQGNLASSQLLVGTMLVLAGTIALFALSGQLTIAQLGEDEATSLGLRVQRTRWIALLIASLVTAAAVALSGPIGFVGLVCPHLGRRIVGNDQRKLLPLAALLGAALLAIADALSRWLASRRGVDTILPVGVLTGLLGGPFFLLLLWRQKHRS